MHRFPWSRLLSVLGPKEEQYLLNSMMGDLWASLPIVFPDWPLPLTNS
jgi:hypothetical protein